MVRERMESWFEIKVRAILGPGDKDDKEVVILGRRVRWTPKGIEYEADPKHRQIVLEYFGFQEGSRALGVNGDREEREEEGDSEPLGKEEAKAYRGLAARLNYMSLDCPDLQFGNKAGSREMASPTRGSWKYLKKMARYSVGIEAIIWHFGWQDEPQYSVVKTDSDWGGTARDRKSTSGGYGCSVIIASRRGALPRGPML